MSDSVTQLDALLNQGARVHLINTVNRQSTLTLMWERLLAYIKSALDV